MTTSTSYEDWIPHPPNPGDPTFQTQVAVQYMANAAPATEDPPSEPGDLFKYQLFDKDFLRTYDRLLMFYEAGTGKTCAYLSVAEDFRSLATQSRVGVLTDALVAYQQAYQGVIKRVIVLLKGTTLVEEFRKQLVCRCTPGTYLTPKVLGAKTERAQRRAATVEINKWYTVETYIKFYNKIRSMDRATLAHEYDGCMFIMDEIHALQANEIYADKEDRGHMSDEERSELLEEVEIDEEAPQERSLALFSRVYRALWNVVHAPRWCKVILATATPMINSSSDLIAPMNLLLPENMQLAQNTPLKTWTLAQFRNVFSGYISYVRAGDTGVDTVYVGTPLTPDSKMMVERVEMSTFQSGVYVDVVKQQRRGVRNDERQASNFVFPDGSYGGVLKRQLKRGATLRGMGLYVDSQETDMYVRSNLWRSSIKTLDDIRKSSALYAAIIEGVRRSPGLCFVYQELFNGSGAVVLAMCMETMGYKRYRSSSSAFRRTRDSDVKPLCAEGGERTLANVQPGLRYGLITSETTEEMDQSLLELFNSPENADGKYIKVLIGSRVVRDGINLANVLDVFLPAMWTPSGMYQAMQRAIRATSHVDMVRRVGRVNVRIHRMASVAISPQAYSVDLDMYKIIEDKDKEIAKVRRSIKQVASDCWLHYQRNVRGGEDYSPECDYDLCTYVCVDPQPTLADVERFTTPAFVNKDSVASLITEVFPQAFSETSDVALSDLVRWMKAYATWSEVYVALLKCKSERILFQDRFGQPSEVATVHDRVVLVPPATLSSDADLASFYRSAYITVRPQTFRSWYVSQVGAVAAQEVGLVEADAVELETAVLTGAPIPPKDVNFYYVFKRPVRQLEMERVKYEHVPGQPRPRGRKPMRAVLRDVPLGPESEEGPMTVRVHTLYTIPATIESTNAVSMYESLQGRIRVLDEGETAWRDAGMSETVVYNALIRGRIRQQLETYERTGLYGSVYGDGIFRIHDVGEGLRGDVTDRRKLGRGVKCDGLDDAHMQEYLRKLDITVSSGSRVEICAALYRAFEEKGRLFVLRPS